MPPLLTTPARDAAATCSECGATLVRTGKPTTMADVPATPATSVALNAASTTRVRGHAPFHGWVPAILVTICPNCDAFVPKEQPAEAVAGDHDTAVKEVRESYLERLARESEETNGEQG